MMGLDIPPAAFGAGWQDYRVFSTAAVLLSLACILFGGLLGDFFGRRQVMIVGTLVSVVANVLAAFSPSVAWFRHPIRRGGGRLRCCRSPSPSCA